MIPFQNEFKLFTQRNVVIQKIAETQSRLKTLQSDTQKCEKELTHCNASLETIDKQISNSKELYQRAFAYILKSQYNGDVINLFQEYKDQDSVVAAYTSLKTTEALVICLMYMTVKCETWDDLLMMQNLAMTCKRFYSAVTRFVKLSDDLLNNHKIVPCIVHIYPKQLIYSHIFTCYDELSDPTVYNPFSNLYKIKPNPIHYIKIWKKWVYILIVGEYLMNIYQSLLILFQSL